MNNEKLNQFRELVEEVHEILSKQQEIKWLVDKSEVERAAELCNQAADILDRMDAETRLKLAYHSVLDP